MPKPRSYGQSTKPGSTDNHKRTPTSDGGYIEDRGSHSIKYRADNTREWMKTPGRTVRYDTSGTSRTFKKGGRDVTERRVLENNTTRVERTYVRNNRTVIRNYNTYVYGGYSYHSYVPAITYDSWYYGYLHHSW